MNKALPFVPRPSSSEAYQELPGISPYSVAALHVELSYQMAPLSPVVLDTHLGRIHNTCRGCPESGTLAFPIPQCCTF